ncbi:KAT8 regulatory NSL complex subunit 1-like [Babylonia areolata]|uniref:KAT8 regulatory NSL complex subunit 1-like n=1 Tax=Babylonia areolata TaxID=304850 RepID=UPI003FD45A17
MAAMAPALTEAATQAKIKLPETSTNTAAASGSVSRRNLSKKTQKELHAGIPRTKLSKSVQSHGTAVPSRGVYLNGDSQSNEGKQSSALLTEPTRFKSAYSQDSTDPTTDRQNSFQDEFLKTIKHLYSVRFSKTTQIMNQPSARPDNEEEKCHDQNAKNGSHVPAPSDVGKTVVGNSRGETRVPRQRPASGPLLSQERLGTVNMCLKQGMGRRVESPDPNANRCTELPQRTNEGSKCTSRSGHCPAFISSSSESMSEGEKFDENVLKAQSEVSKKQAQLERRIEFLMRRVRRLQAKQVEVHARRQLDNYVAYQHQNLQTVATTIIPTQVNENSCDLKKELLSDGVKNLSTAALVTLVQKMQASNSFQQQPQSVQQEVTTSVLKMSDDVRSESFSTAEKLSMNLSFMQAALDSDGTESSSGGESGDDDGPEGVHFPVPSTPLVRRAEWKWSAERAAVASRWTWLQAQVSDLEYRIRQQSEIYKQARLSKGPVLLGEPPPPQDFLRSSSHPAASVCCQARTGNPPSTATVTGSEISPLPVSALLSNVDKQASRLTQSLGNCLSPANTSPASSVSSSHPKSSVSSPAAALNGLIDSPLSAASVDVEGGSPPSLSADPHLAVDPVDLSPVLDPSCRAARCLPLKHPLRKRKLLRTSGLHLKSVKAARLSSVSCHCHTSVTPCVLCSGRVNIMQTVDASSMSYSERVALLDHSYHQVLSFQEEVPLSVRFEGLLRSGDWQNKTSVRRPRAESDQRRQKYTPNVTDGRKKPFRKNAASVIIQSAKIRNKYEQKTGRKPGPPRGKRLGKRALNAELKRRKNYPVLGTELKRKNMKGAVDYPGSGTDTPAASPLSRDASLNAGPHKEKEVRKRRGESAYDINNIVIPHSMASLTRVEKLEYKEIPIPRWRDLTKEDEAEEDLVPDEEQKVHLPKSNGQLCGQLANQSAVEEEEEIEDLSDDTFILRHKRCEVEERKHFSSFVQLPPSRRNRSNPHLHTQDKETGTPVPSRPHTPSLPVSMGTQASLDGGDMTGEDWMDCSGGRGSVSLPQTPRCSTPVPHFTLSEDDSLGINVSTGGMWGPGQPRRGSLSAGQRERLTLGSSLEEGEGDNVQVVKPWPLRQFPLSDEEMSKLSVTEVTRVEEKPQRSLRAVSSMTTLHPQAVDGGSQAGSSVSGSLPPSPLPSTSSTSVAGDIDAADPEWIEDSTSKKYNSQQKAIKR